MTKHYLEVGTMNGVVIINHHDLILDEEGRGHICFSPTQAIQLGELLIRKAEEAEQERKELKIS